MKIGTPVIINTFDRPCTRLVAIVIGRNDQAVFARYLAKELRGRTVGGYADTVTPVAEFGVELTFETADDGSTRYRCEVVGASRATYKGGRPRQWQQYVDDPNVLEAHEEVAAIAQADLV